MAPSTYLRRNVLKAGAATAVAATAGLAIAACDTSDSTSQNPQSSGSVSAALPTYVPFAGGIQPDFPGSADGVLPCYTSYPRSPKAVYEGRPLDGDEVKIFGSTGGLVPQPLERNDYWQELNTRSGGTLDFVITPSTDYPSKLATLLAGNDLPDVVSFLPGLVPQLPRVLKAVFHDLTEYLAGDAIKKYPFLANIQHPADSVAQCHPQRRGLRTA